MMTSGVGMAPLCQENRAALIANLLSLITLTNCRCPGVLAMYCPNRFGSMKLFIVSPFSAPWPGDPPAPDPTTPPSANRLLDGLASGYREANAEARALGKVRFRMAFMNCNP